MKFFKTGDITYNITELKKISQHNRHLVVLETYDGLKHHLNDPSEDLIFYFNLFIEQDNGNSLFDINKFTIEIMRNRALMENL